VYALDLAHALVGPLDDLSRQSITQKKVTHDDTTDTWTYSISEGATSASVSSPDGNNVTETKYCTTSGCATGKSGLVYRTTAPFTMTERHWTNLTFSGANTASPGGILTFNPVVDFEYTTLLDSSNAPLKMSARAFQYDYNGNLTQTTEYDWFDLALVSRDAQGVPTGVPAAATVLRVTNNSYYDQATTAASANVYAKRSVTTGAPLILNAPQQTIMGTGKVQFSYDSQDYGIAPTIGNLTTRQVWVDLDNKWITTSNTYDLFGNIATATDARGKVTEFFYDDATHATPTRVVVDPQNGTAAQTTTTTYDSSTGLVTSQTDVNGQRTDIDYTNQLLGVAIHSAGLESRRVQP
jgi:YD repeat-containing protein